MFTIRTYFIQKKWKNLKKTCQNAIPGLENKVGFMQKTKTYEK